MIVLCGMQNADNGYFVVDFVLTYFISDRYKTCTVRTYFDWLENF